MISPASRILLARQLAGLRRQRWTTIDAVGFVTAALPAGELRAVCERALQSMRAGAVEGKGGSDPLELTLARGDGALPETFDFLAEALEARELASASQESAASLARLLIVGPLVLGALFGWISPFGDIFAGHPLPAVTQLDLSLITLLKWAGLPLAAVAWLLVPRWLSRVSPGARHLGVAARLFEFGASDGQGSREFGLTQPELRFFLWRESVAGPAAAARDLARALTVEGREAITSFNRFAPIVAALVGLVLFGGVMIPLAGPVFTIAGAVH